MKIPKKPSETNFLLLGNIAFAVFAMIFTIWFLFKTEQDFKALQLKELKNSALTVNKQVSKYISQNQALVMAFTKHNTVLIEQIAADFSAEQKIETLRQSINDFFPDYFTFIIRTADGKFVPDDFGEFVGEFCRRDMAELNAVLIDKTQQNPLISKNYKPLIHPQPFNYHFDITSEWTANSGARGLLMISFPPNLLVELLQNQQREGHNLYLLRQDIPDLIEVAANGWRDQFKRDIRLSEKELTRIVFREDIKGTRWQVAYLMNPNVLQNKQRLLLSVGGAVFITLLLIVLKLINWDRLSKSHKIKLDKARKDAFNDLHNELAFQKLAIDEHAIVSVTDTLGNIVYVNEKFCSISGYSREELLGQNHRLLFSGEHPPEFFEDMWATISNGHTWHGAIKNKSKSKSKKEHNGYYWVQTTIVPTLNKKGKPFQYVAIRTEITQQKQAEAELNKSHAQLEKKVAERTQELKTALEAEQDYNTLQKQFVSMASHEFRTPLSIIDMTAQRLLKRQGTMSDEQMAERYTKIRSAAQRITGLIERTLSSASLDEGKLSYTPVLCDIHDIITTCILAQTEISKDYIIESDLDELPDEITADPGHLNQVLTNLLSNAVKYSPKNKIINVKGWQEDQNILVSVTDQGIGIPETEIPKMFNRFFRTSNAAGIPGTGIGLNLVQQLLALQGGTIAVESTDGQGSTFIVTLPLLLPSDI